MLTIFSLNTGFYFLHPFKKRARQTTINNDVKISVLIMSASNVSVVALRFTPDRTALFSACLRGV